MKIGAIGIRTKIIVGDAATWYLLKKYLDNIVITGAITPEEKAKLAGIEENANNYTHPETHPSSIITQDANNRFVTDAEKTTWNAKASTDVATTSVAGLMSSSDKTKLDGIATGANNYTHPETHPASILDVVDVVDGAANKFLNERGEMVAVAHESLTDKNSEADFQHIDTTVTKPTLDAADMVAIKDSVTGKMVLTKKSNIDESFKKLAVRRGAVFNEATGFYELNGLTDITEAQMMDIYNYTSQLINVANQDEIFRGLPIRTNYIPVRKSSLPITMRYTYLLCSKLEIFKSTDVFMINNGAGAFDACTKLHTVDSITITSGAILTNMFLNCSALVTCNLKNLGTNLSLSSSPLISLESLQYLIQYRGNGTTQITITVHPTVFAKLTDNVNYPTWYAVAQDALTKFITFATV